MENHGVNGLVALLSHDLKTPLGPLTLAVSNLAEGSWETGETQGLARIALAQTERLRRLIDAALIASGRIPSQESIPLSVSSVLVDASIQYQQTGGRVTHGPFPAIAVVGDRARLSDALAGLFEVVAGDTGAVSVELRVKVGTAEIVIAGTDARLCVHALAARDAQDSPTAFALAARKIVEDLGGEIELVDEGLVVTLPSCARQEGAA